ncbi:MAG: GNAT family N-acetyltransferase, partial [Rhodobacteraceae bacterium]|nr:GNAT family N-acetyltransferase [Paracoccaceae bacterium]
MTPADLAQLHGAAFSQSRAWSEAEFQDLLVSPLSFVLGDSHSFALGRVIADEAELLTIATHPKARRQGLARARLTAFEDMAKARGATSVFLEVAANNKAAFALYTDQGYIQTARRKAYYTDPAGNRVDA